MADLDELFAALGAVDLPIRLRDVLLDALHRARREADRAFAQRLAASSSVGAFIASECRRGPGRTIGSGELFEAYSRWCGGEPPVNRKSFVRLLRGLGLKTTPIGDSRCAWIDLDLGARPAYLVEILAAGRVSGLAWYRVEVTGPRGLVGTAIVVAGDNDPIVARARRSDGQPFSITLPMRAAIRAAVDPHAPDELGFEAAE